MARFKPMVTPLLADMSEAAYQIASRCRTQREANEILDAFDLPIVTDLEQMQGHLKAIQLDRKPDTASQWSKAACQGEVRRMTQTGPVWPKSHMRNEKGQFSRRTVGRVPKPKMKHAPPPCAEMRRVAAVMARRKVS